LCGCGPEFALRKKKIEKRNQRNLSGWQQVKYMEWAKGASQECLVSKGIHDTTRMTMRGWLHLRPTAKFEDEFSVIA
jgi:hypothetical protein